VLQQLERRFGPLASDLRDRLHNATAPQLDAVAEALLSAPTLAGAVHALLPAGNAAR
jgi:hypothetical protein